MATIVNKNSIVFEMPYLRENSLTKTFWNVVQTTLKKESIGTVIELLKTCDFYNGGMYENVHFGKITNTTMTYYIPSKAVKVRLEYGDFKKEEQVILGYAEAGILLSDAGNPIQQKIAYFGSHSNKDQLNKCEGYKTTFKLQLCREN
jgi:hypothetical protein